VFRRCLLKTLSDEMVLFKLIRKHSRIEINIFGFIILLRFTRVGRKIFMNDVIFEVLKTLSHVLCSLRNPRKVKRDSYFFHLFYRRICSFRAYIFLKLRNPILFLFYRIFMGKVLYL
jgi:hypothetical protein